jgi:hypothetical protein
LLISLRDDAACWQVREALLSSAALPVFLQVNESL